jgi:hypothetical protein
VQSDTSGDSGGLVSRGRHEAEKAVVRFTSPLEAHRAVREKQGSFCGNTPVRLRVLQ